MDHDVTMAVRCQLSAVVLRLACAPVGFEFGWSSSACCCSMYCANRSPKSISTPDVMPFVLYGWSFSNPRCHSKNWNAGPNNRAHILALATADFTRCRSAKLGRGIAPSSRTRLPPTVLRPNLHTASSVHHISSERCIQNPERTLASCTPCSKGTGNVVTMAKCAAGNSAPRSGARWSRLSTGATSSSLLVACCCKQAIIVTEKFVLRSPLNVTEHNFPKKPAVLRILCRIGTYRSLQHGSVSSQPITGS